MGSFIQLLNEWEIQLLVLASFMLQILLFFTGSLRRYKTDIFLRVFIWLAYLGADFVAVYALGFLSRHEDTFEGTRQLAFFWAPFLLIHLGGQDTITAFSIEDNNLWLRHLLTLIVQASLALYCFWKTIGKKDMPILIPGILLFVSGIIKYGERTLSLLYGSPDNMRNSISQVREEELPRIDHDDTYSGIVGSALLSALPVRELFAGSTLIQMGPVSSSIWSEHQLGALKLLEVELGMMYDDLYTKAVVLRTWSGIILRCISHVSFGIALVLFFLASDKQRYHRADVAITYVLFFGGFFLDVCAALILAMSPWSWAWLKARRCRSLACMSWFLFSSNIGWEESRPLWSSSMGQYNLLCWMEGMEQKRACQLPMVMIIYMMNLAPGNDQDEMLFLISRFLDIKYMEVDKTVMCNILRECHHLAAEIERGDQALQWPRIASLPEKLQDKMKLGFEEAIMYLHVFTEVHLRRYPTDGTVQDVLTMVDVCRKLSNYMMYLLVSYPDLLPVTGSVFRISDSSKDDIVNHESACRLQPCHDTLKEIRDMWVLLLAYAAGKSQPEVHAALLSKGGELFTFVWLLLAKHRIGDSGTRRIDLGTDISIVKVLD